MSEPMWLYDSATVDTLYAEKIVDVSDLTNRPGGARMLYTRAKRGRIVQLRMGPLWIHYFFDEPAGAAMIREDEDRFGFFPGTLMPAILQHAPGVDDATGALAPAKVPAPGADAATCSSSPAPSAETNVSPRPAASARTCATEVASRVRRERAAAKNNDNQD